MRLGSSLLAALLGSAVLAPSVPAAEPAPPAAVPPSTDANRLPPLFDPDRHMRVEEVKPGMKGHGLSVFRGTEVERFDVEVISVLKNFNPKADVVLIRCKGANLEHTGAVAGMSGSPIYLKDERGRERMIGAFAYGWQLSKDPVAGVQPIEYMLAAPPAQPPVAAEPKLDSAQSDKDKPNQGVAGPDARPAPRISWDYSPVLRAALDGREPAAARDEPSRIEPLGSVPGANRASGFAGDLDGPVRLQPLATPLTTAGVPPKVMEQFGPLFAAHGLTLLQGGGGGSGTISDVPARLTPGSVLAVPLLVGDADMTAVGTTTEVLGDRVFGFGHPFQNEGSVLLPMGGGMVHTVIANLSTSFKLGSMTTKAGRLVSDQAVGISGQLGEFPPLVPIDLRVLYTDGSLDRSYHFEAVAHPRFTPLLGAVALSSAVTGANELPQYHTLNFDLKLEFANGQTIDVANTAVNSSPQDLFLAIAQPIATAADNPFERVMMKRISGTVRVTPQARQARIMDVNVPRSKYRPGETVRAFVRHKPFRGPEGILPVELELPDNLPDGTYQLIISDWQRFTLDEMASKPFRFTAENVGEMFDVLRDVSGLRRDALYLRLVRQADGVAIGRTALPQLPGSRRQIITGAGRSNTSRYVSSETKVVPTELVMAGAANFALTVDNDRKVQVADPQAPSGASPAPAAPAAPSAPAAEAPAKLPGGPAENPQPGPGPTPAPGEPPAPGQPPKPGPSEPPGGK